MSNEPNLGAGQVENNWPAPTARRAPTIIVPLDGSVHAMAALPVAKTMAEILGATLSIVHIAESTLSSREVLDKLGLSPEQIRGSVVEPATGVPAESIVRLATEWHSMLIVMCTYTGTVMLHGELGPVGEEVLRSAPCPVVLVRPERGFQPWTLQHILLPHDGTPISAGAIGPAADLAHRAGAELIVLHVAVSEARQPVEPGTFSGPQYLDQPQHEWPAWSREFIQRLSNLGHLPEKMKLRLFLARGEAGAEIVRFASERNTDLIVLGWRGSIEAERAATIKRVVHDTSCPVLIVRVEA